MSISLYGWPFTLDLKEFITSSQTNQEKKISIVIPTLNQAETIEDTLLSIIHQDYKNLEIIVIDGGSSDNTIGIIKKYEAWISYFISGADSGQSDAINKGFEVATGDIFGWINSDDFYLPFAFRRISHFFERNQEIDILIGAGDVVSRDCKFLKHIIPMQLKRENLLKWFDGAWVMQQSCFWSNKIWKKSGGVDQALKLLMDFDLWFRFSDLGKSAIINEPLAAMRYYPQIKTVSLKNIVKEEAAYVFAKNKEFDAVKKIVSELVVENKVLLSQKSSRENMMVSSFLRRFRIIGEST
jgi:glycosyltransferase involved in cell wall biosynthesis